MKPAQRKTISRGSKLKRTLLWTLPSDHAWVSVEELTQDIWVHHRRSHKNGSSIHQVSMDNDACAVSSRAMGPWLSYHHFPSKPHKQALRLQMFQVREGQLRPHYWVCSWHSPMLIIRSQKYRYAVCISIYAPWTKWAMITQQNTPDHKGEWYPTAYLGGSGSKSPSRELNCWQCKGT